jgi:FkbM family methyltransferase
MSSILWRELKNVRVQLHLDRHDSARTYSLCTSYGPLFLRDNFGDVTNLPDIFWRQVYRVGPLPRSGAILDVGANIGLAAAWLAHTYADRPIYCFEPVRSNAAMISLNCPSAEVLQSAVGSRRGRVSLHVDADGVMASRIPCPWDTTDIDFDVVVLDEFSASRELDRVALIKIDVEGMECDVLDGAKETLDRTHSVVLETHAPALHRGVLDRLRCAGFRIEKEQFWQKAGMVTAVKPFQGHDRPEISD